MSAPRQRRPLPLLRLHRPPEIRAKSLHERAAPTRETRTRRHRPAHQALPRQPPDRADARERATRGRATPARDQTAARRHRRRDHAQRAGARALLRAFEQGKLSPERCEARLTRLQTRLDDLHAQHAELSSSTPHTAHRRRQPADLAAVADQLEQILTTSQPQKAKALIRELVAELKVNSKTEIQPSYYLVGARGLRNVRKSGRDGIEPPTSGV